jgi:hypothetical protein
MKHYNVLIVTPGSSMEAEYVKSLAETLAECSNRGITYKFLNASGSLVYNARELAMSSGGETTSLDPDDTGPLGGTVSYDKIFWIDSDISWKTWQFFRLYESDHDIITGAYLLADNQTTSVHSWETNQYYPRQEIMNMNEVTKIQSAGFGFIAMKSGVFEKIERPWFKHYTQNMQKSDGTTIAVMIGEDISWCIDAYRNEMDIYFDPQVLVEHTKRVKISW